jgi:hypothetical protein
VKTYDIFIKKTVTERLTVSANSFQSALKELDTGSPESKEEDVEAVHSTVVVDRATGTRENREAIEGDEGDEAPEPPFTFDVTIGADLRGYHSMTIEASSAEEARAAALAKLVDEGDNACSWTWQFEEVQGDISLAAKNLDTDEEDQFHDVPDWNGPRYGVLESIVRDLAGIRRSGDETPTLASLVNRAKLYFPPKPPAVM